MTNNTSKTMRFERKHFLDKDTAFLLKQRLSYAIEPDESNAGGRYRVSSIYFDDQYNTAMYEKINGCRSREKLRMRYYNGTSDSVYLECKEKHGEMIHKQREELTEEQFEMMRRGDYGFMRAASPDAPALLKKFYTDHLQRQMRPVVLVDYVRQAYRFKAGNVRVTFDSDLTAARPLSTQRFSALPERYEILEIKYDHFLPLFIQEMLGGFSFTQRMAASKYVMARLAMQGK